LPNHFGSLAPTNDGKRAGERRRASAERLIGVISSQNVGFRFLFIALGLERRGIRGDDHSTENDIGRV